MMCISACMRWSEADVMAVADGKDGLIDPYVDLAESELAEDQHGRLAVVLSNGDSIRIPRVGRD